MNRSLLLHLVVNIVFVVVTNDDNDDGDKKSCTILVDIHFSVSKMTFFTYFIHLNKKEKQSPSVLLNNLINLHIL